MLRLWCVEAVVLRLCLCPPAHRRAPGPGVVVEHPAGVSVAPGSEHGAVHPRVLCQGHRRGTTAADGQQQAEGERRGDHYMLTIFISFQSFTVLSSNLHSIILHFVLF